MHGHLGAEALPSTCRHFPRLCLIDDRGVRVSLSHACPTAASLLVDHVGPLQIVPGPPAVPGLVVPEGLDVRGALPPRLTSRVLMDLEAVTAWEAHVVDVLAGPLTWSAPVDLALGVLAANVAQLERWRPSDGPLVDWVRGLEPFDRAVPHDGDATDAESASRVWTIAASACEPPWIPDPLPRWFGEADARWVAPSWSTLAPIVRRYLAARAFAAWAVWQAEAAHGLTAYLAIAGGVLRAECVRVAATLGVPLDRAGLIEALGRADRLLVHYADGTRLAAHL